MRNSRGTAVAPIALAEKLGAGWAADCEQSREQSEQQLGTGECAAHHRARPRRVC